MIMNEFGLVKVDKEIILSALKNYEQKKSILTEQYHKIRNECLDKKITIKTWFGHKTISEWDSFKNLNEVFDKFDELGGSENIHMIYFVDNVFESIKNLASVGMDIYLNPKQAAFIAKWRSH